jgi:hypothetical protein
MMMMIDSPAWQQQGLQARAAVFQPVACCACIALDKMRQAVSAFSAVCVAFT